MGKDPINSFVAFGSVGNSDKCTTQENKVGERLKILEPVKRRRLFGVDVFVVLKSVDGPVQLFTAEPVS